MYSEDCVITTTATGGTCLNYTPNSAYYSTTTAAPMSQNEFLDYFIKYVTPEFLLTYIGESRLKAYLGLDSIILGEGIDILEE